MLTWILPLTDRLLLTDDAQTGIKAFEYVAHSRLDVDGMDDRQEWKTLTVSLSLCMNMFHTEDELR